MFVTTDEFVDMILFGRWPFIIRLLVVFLSILLMTLLVIAPAMLTLLVLANVLPREIVSDFESDIEKLSVGLVSSFLWLCFWILVSAIWDTQIEKRRKH